MMRKMEKGGGYCSSCFGQYMDREYVDLDAYWDGPIIDEHNGMKQPIDDLVLCETCLKEAGKFIGLGHAKDLKDENRELGFAIEKREEQLKIKDKQIADLTYSLDQLVQHPVKRPQGRPKQMVN